MGASLARATPLARVMAAAEREKFLPHRRLVFIGASPEGCPGSGPLFPYPSHLRAKMRRLEVNRNPVRLKQLHQRVGNLLPHSLLDSKSAGEKADKPRQLRNADDVLVSDVSHIRMPEER